MIIASRLNVDIARRLVKDINIFVCNKVDRERKPLFLPAGHIVGVLGDDFIQPAVFLDKRRRD